MAAIVRATIDTVRPAMHAKRIRLEERIDDTPPVLGDHHRLQQVFWNVLSNALKFTGSDGAITVTLRRIGEIGRVRDHRHRGWHSSRSPPVRVRSFSSGRFVDHAEAWRTGTGSGDREAHRRAARRHGPGGECRRRARRDVHDSAAERRSRSCECARVSRRGATQGPSLPSVLRGRTILVVEDHDDARELIVGVLEGAGARVLSASTAQEAIDRATDVRPDVLVADLGLPGEDGYALLARIRAMFPADPRACADRLCAGDRSRSRPGGWFPTPRRQAGGSERAPAAHRRVVVGVGKRDRRPPCRPSSARQPARSLRHARVRLLEFGR